MNFRVLRLGLILFVALVAACSDPTPEPAQAPEIALTDTPVQAAKQGKIAFSSAEDIYVINPDGSGEMRLTGSSTRNLEPTWSPDGTRIAFSSTRDGDSEIYVMNADGSAQTRITNSPGLDLHPSWSPDGSNIAFVSAGAIFLMDPDGSNRRLLTGRLGSGLTWSPDGSKIAFKGSDAIYVVDADGTNELRLTANVWSGDQYTLQVAVTTWREDRELRSTRPWPVLEGGDECIGTVTPLTGELTEKECNPYIDIAALAELGFISHSNPAMIESANTALNTTATNLKSGPLAWYVDETGSVKSFPDFPTNPVTVDPTWSPDGAKIAFTQYGTDLSRPPADVMVINADGSNPTTLTQAPGYSGGLTWSPDGANIAFRSNGNEIHVISADGTSLANLSQIGDSSDDIPVWSPDGSMIAFGCTGGGTRALCVMNADGSNKTRIAIFETFIAGNVPDWGPALIP